MDENICILPPPSEKKIKLNENEHKPIPLRRSARIRSKTIISDPIVKEKHK